MVLNSDMLELLMKGDITNIIIMDERSSGAYLAYARNAKFLSVRTYKNISFMRLCVVELYSMDLPAAYQHAFVYIRQLAVDLRQAMTKKTKVLFQRIYNWQFINCLHLWASLIISQLSTSKVPFNS